MKRYCHLLAVIMVAVVLISFASCAPLKFQGTFNASFSLSECSVSDDQYQYRFYGDGRGIEKNTVSGTSVSFTYTVLNGSMTVDTENHSFTYQYEIEDQTNLKITYQKDGKNESVLLVKK